MFDVQMYSIRFGLLLRGATVIRTENAVSANGLCTRQRRASISSWIRAFYRTRGTSPMLSAAVRDWQSVPSGTSICLNLSKEQVHVSFYFLFSYFAIACRISRIKDSQFLRATASMLSAHMLSQFRLSVCPSVCPSHGWFMQKRLKLGSCNFHHTVAPSL